MERQQWIVKFMLWVSQKCSLSTLTLLVPLTEPKGLTPSVQSWREGRGPRTWPRHFNLRSRSCKEFASTAWVSGCCIRLLKFLLWPSRGTWRVQGDRQGIKRELTHAKESTTREDDLKWHISEQQPASWEAQWITWATLKLPVHKSHPRLMNSEPLGAGPRYEHAFKLPRPFQSFEPLSSRLSCRHTLDCAGGGPAAQWTPPPLQAPQETFVPSFFLYFLQVPLNFSC